MRWAAYVAAVCMGLFMIPLEKNDVGKLQPVELLYLYIDEELVILKTDTEDIGQGKTVGEALHNLHETTPGIIYLDTADYLVVNRNADDLAYELSDHMKRRVRLCVAESAPDLKEAAVYLSVHKPKWTIADKIDPGELDVLTVEKSVINLKENS